MTTANAVFRFAPSPNGHLHLGHARSALLNAGMARAAGGRFLVRIEDIDRARSSATFEAAIISDLARLGLRSDGPVRRQSDHFHAYQAGLSRLKDMGLVYPAFLSRTGIRRAVVALEASGHTWPRDPDGVPIYPGTERTLPDESAVERIAAGEQVIWRLHMAKAITRTGPLCWLESGGPDETDQVDLDALSGERRFRRIAADPARWGDVILARADIPTSYHLSVVIDDAVQEVSDVVRGVDLFHATSVHRLLQHLLDLPAPRYHHHRLVLDAIGRKLSKSDGDGGLGALLDKGMTPADIRRLVGL